MNVNELIEKYKEKFKGEILDEPKAKELSEKFGHIEYFEDWVKIIKGIKLINVEFEINEKLDKSGLGANMQIMPVEDQIDEAFNFYPGIAAVKNGYIPFATCLSGSGDPYFVKGDSNEINIFRIPHDSVFGNDEMDRTKIEFVISLESLLSIS